MGPETGTDQLGVYEDGIFKAKRKVSVVSVFSKLWKEGLGVYLVFVVTLSMFPGVTSQIKPKNPDFLGNGWYQVMLTSTFMVFDFTNGYCGTLAMGFGPDELDPWEKENGGIQMSFFLNFGVVSGVNISLAFTG